MLFFLDLPTNAETIETACFIERGTKTNMIENEMGIYADISHL